MKIDHFNYKQKTLKNKSFQWFPIYQSNWTLPSNCLNFNLIPFFYLIFEKYHLRKFFLSYVIFHRSFNIHIWNWFSFFHILSLLVYLVWEYGMKNCFKGASFLILHCIVTFIAFNFYNMRIPIPIKVFIVHFAVLLLL